MAYIRMLCIAVAALAADLIAALGLITFEHNRVSLGVVVAFVTGLAVAVSLSIFSIARSRKSTEV